MKVAVLVLGLCATLAWAAPDAGTGKISFEFHGNLSEAVRQLAAEGHLNVVVQGDLNRPAELYLHDVSPEEALRTVAKLHGLTLSQDGSVWTLSAPKHVAVRMGAHPGNKPDRVQTGDVHIREGERVENAVSYGGTLKVDGHVEGDAVAFGGHVHLGPHAEVEGDAVAFGGKVTAEEGAIVHGDQTSFGGAGMTQAIGHMMTQLPRSAQHWKSYDHDEDRGPTLVQFLMRFALFFGLGFLLWWLLPNQMREVEEELKRDPVRCGLIGFVGAVALLPVTILLIFTLVGIPVVPLLWGAVGLAVLMGSIALAHALGLRIPSLSQGKTQAVVLAVGVLILTLVGLIPFIGPLALGLIGMLGMGAVVRTRFGTRKRAVPAA